MKEIHFLMGMLICLTIFSCIGNGSCEQFNIDGFELSTGFDIPKVSDVECFSGDTMRISFFYLNIENTRFKNRYQTMQGYADYFKMKKTAIQSNLPLRYMHLFPGTLPVSNTEVYTKEGTTKGGRYWKILVVKEINLVIAEMETKVKE